MSNLQTHKQQLTKQKTSIGFPKGKFTDKKIAIYNAYHNEKKIRDFNSNDDMKPLIDVIGKWRFYLGVKEKLSKEEMFMNTSFIKENFSELNVSDIHEAINLSLKGSLGIDAQNYQTFTPLYISKVLVAYKSYRSEVIVDISQHALKKGSTDVAPTENEKLQICRDNIKTMFLSKGDDNFYDYGSVVYDFIKRNKLVVFTEDLVNVAMAYGKEESLKNRRKSAFKDVIQNTETNLADAQKNKERKIRSLARNYVVIQWLKSIKNIDAYVKTITREMI